MIANGNDGVKPEIRPVFPGSIPQELKAIPRWVVWKSELEGIKWKKPPFSPRSGYQIHVKMPPEKQWGTFDQAMAALENGINIQGEHRRFDGIGIYPGAGLVGIDADKCVDEQNRITIPHIRSWVDESQSYVELSPTITKDGHRGGIRAFILGVKPGELTKATWREISYEMYAEGGNYLTVTGHRLNENPVTDDQGSIDDFYEMILKDPNPKDDPEAQPATDPKREPPPVHVTAADIPDGRVLDTMFRIKGSQIETLYRTGTMGGDHSSEDYMVMEALAYFTGDPARTEVLFRASAMYRESGKGKDYVAKSIEKIFTGKTKFFDWNQGNGDQYDKRSAGAEEKTQSKEDQNVVGSDAAKKQKIVDGINTQYAAILLGGKFRILREYHDPITGFVDIAFMGLQDFHAYYANKLFHSSDEKPPVSYSKVWVTSPCRREYEGLVLAPPSAGKIAPPTTFYNLWRGFGIEPKKGDWSMFKDHIFSNICSENEKHFIWLMAWLARIVQDPGGERPGTAVVLMGEKGNGKGVFANMFKHIFGRHFIALSNQRHVTGNFNSHLKDKVVLFCDEGFWGGNKADEGVLKALITEPSIPIEAKGQDVVEVKNHVNLIMATNNSWVIPASMDERRFFVLDVGNRNRLDGAFFSKLRNQMEHCGGVEAMLYDLLEWDDHETNLRAAPKTKALFSQIEYSMSPIERWWFRKLYDGTNLNDGAGNWYSEIITDKLHADFLAYARELRFSGEVLSPNQFGIELKKLSELIKRRQQGSVNQDGTRPRKYHFKSLEEHRAEFQAKMGIEIEW